MALITVVLMSAYLSFLITILATDSMRAEYSLKTTEKTIQQQLDRESCEHEYQLDMAHKGLPASNSPCL
ncbi:MAG: hypothetical protein M3Q73_01665 [bacterium]|nr:hypothetical protein [bacterium]